MVAQCRRHGERNRDGTLRPATRTFERQVDKARVEPRQQLITAAEPLHRAGAVIFQHHIRTHREAVDHLLPFLALEVDRKAALVAVEGSEETGAEPAESTGMVTVGRRLDLDHVGAELGEDEPGGRPHDRVAELQNLDAGERRRQRAIRHQAAAWRRNASRLPAWINSPGS